MQHPETVLEHFENGTYQDGPSGRLVELLDRKRKEVDQEISDFKARKEKEYRLYEQHLRIEKEYRLYEQHLRIENESITVDERISSGSRIAASKQDETHPVDSYQRLSVTKLDKTDKESGVGKETSAIKNGENRRPAHIDFDRGPDHVLEGRSIAPGHPIASTPPHERELEFRGLFTPSYLPLLDGPSKSHAQTETVKPISPSISRSNSTPSLSSSATLPTMTLTPLLSSPGHQRLSASVPRQKPPHRRSSSARSDTSLTSLRSSLRDPRQPRSPKRVLFSIDNTVVSPNSSPVARRIVPILLPPPSGIAVSQEPAQEAEYDAFNEDKTAIDQVEHAIDESHYPSFAFEQTVSTMANMSSSSRGPQLVEPIITSPMIGGDDFEDINDDDNPLFAFDEDMGLRDLEDEESDKGDELSDLEDEEENTLPIASPHAGSLPIEIKWPARQPLRSRDHDAV